jgi:HAD superfamily hydrolase (TIGR01450 family)
VLSDELDVFLLDLDGVVYVGDRPVPFAAETIARLREVGRVVRFVTNDPRPTREDLAARLRSMGIEAAVDEIASSGRAAALYLREHGLTRVYPVGSDGLARELAAAGLELAGPEEWADAVVVGCDESLGYEHLRIATEHLYAGAAFVATNVDGAFPTERGMAPATGAIVAALGVASGREPVVVGKPEPALFDAATRGLQPGARIGMVGDRIESDVVGAQRYGIPGILVSPDPNAPGADAVIADLRGLFDPRVSLIELAR